MIDYLEISGSPGDEERRVIRAAVEQLLREEAPAPESPWKTGPAAAWSGANPWNRPGW